MRPQIDKYFSETIQKLKDPGLLLVGAKVTGECNVMTIGWGLIGLFWRMPVFIVAVRRSRFTHEFIEDSGEFTVNVPVEGMKKVVARCGEVSGRDHDKFKECKLRRMKGKKVKVPVIRQCTIHYECKVVHTIRVKSSSIPKDVKKKFYSKGDFHTLYFGKILATYQTGLSRGSQSFPVRNAKSDINVVETSRSNERILRLFSSGTLGFY